MICFFAFATLFVVLLSYNFIKKGDKMNKFFKALSEFSYENISKKSQKNSQIALNLAWDARGLNKEISSDYERRAAVCELIFIDVSRNVKRKLNMINRALGYQKSLNRKAKLLLPAKQLKAEQIIQENIDKIKEYERQLLASKTTYELSSIKRPKLTPVQID